MKLEQHISEISELFAKKGFDGMVTVTEGLNYNTTIGKLKDALESLNLKNNETPFSIRTYMQWKNETNYVELYFKGNYSNINGFDIKNLNVEENRNGIKKNLDFKVNGNENLHSSKKLEYMLTPAVKLNFDKNEMSAKIKPSF